MFGLIGYKNVTEDIQKYVKKIHENGFCNVRFHFEIALSKNKTSFLHACAASPHWYSTERDSNES